MNKILAVTKAKCKSGYSGSPSADSRFAVPCPTGQERSPKSASAFSFAPLCVSVE